MSDWPSTRAKLVLAALLPIGWTVERQSGSHKALSGAVETVSADEAIVRARTRR